MKIKAAVVHEKSAPFAIEELDLDDPRDDEVLVRMKGCGVCHTDLVAQAGFMPIPLPAVFGHEGSGVVEKVGSRVTKVKPGDHVVMSFRSCGVCSSCMKGLPANCLDFFKLNFAGLRADGSPTMKKGGETIHASFFSQSSFASYALASERNVVKVRNDVPLELLGPMGCGIQTGAGGVINSLKARPGSSIAVFGAGSVGLSAIMAAAASGLTTVIAVDVKGERLDLALKMGATHVSRLQPHQRRRRNPENYRRRRTVLPGVHGHSGSFPPVCRCPCHDGRLRADRGRPLWRRSESGHADDPERPHYPRHCGGRFYSRYLYPAVDRALQARSFPLRPDDYLLSV